MLLFALFGINKCMPKKLVSEEYGMSFDKVKHPHADLQIPDSWDDVKAFADWWMQNGMPMLIPQDAEVFLSDDATAVTVFRKGRWQIEMYLIHPHPLVPEHEHPGVEVIKMSLTHAIDPIMSNILHRGESHGAGARQEGEAKGFPLFAFQYWQDRDPCTVAAMWKGKTVGPKQESLIKRFNPDAYVTEGYADITRKKI